MVRQFATLQNAHVPLDESIKALVSQMENPVLRNTLSAVKDSISEGKSLADASKQYPGVFNKLYVNMVKAGETSGTLGTVLERLADFMEYQVKVRGQIMQAMMYPLIMIIASIVIIVGMLIFMVPKLAKVFSSMKVKIPWYTQIVLDLSDFLRTSWYFVPVFAGIIYIAVKIWLGSDKGKRQLDVIKIKAPIFGPVFLMISVSRFTKTLSTLLSSGVPIIQALDITKNVVNNMILTEVIEQAKIEVQEGKSLSGTISKSGVFPGLVTHMIATGERSGELEQMLGHVARAYDTEVENKINKNDITNRAFNDGCPYGASRWYYWCGYNSNDGYCEAGTLKKDFQEFKMNISKSLMKPFGQTAKNAGMSIIEILIVIALIGTVMAIMVTNLTGEQDEAMKQALTEISMGIESSLQMYKVNNYRYPTTEQGLEALITKPSGARNGEAHILKRVNCKIHGAMTLATNLMVKHLRLYLRD